MSAPSKRGLVVLVTGGRDYADRAHVFETLDAIHAATPIATLVHGACGMDSSNTDIKYANPRGLRGADRWADEWHSYRDVAVIRHPAHWRKLGPGAGPERNRRMLLSLDDPYPRSLVLVVAFPGDRGTGDCVSKARRYAFTVRPCCAAHPLPGAKP